MQIHGPVHVHGPQSINSPHRVRPTQPNSTPTQSRSGVDQLDISPEAELVSRVRDIPDIRADRVAQIRAQIESGVYETDEKIDIALDRLLDEFV
jgi:negative regulator of flagellin synthesis FlgM